MSWFAELEGEARDGVPREGIHSFVKNDPRYPERPASANKLVDAAGVFEYDVTERPASARGRHGDVPTIREAHTAAVQALKAEFVPPEEVEQDSLDSHGSRPGSASDATMESLASHYSWECDSQHVEEMDAGRDDNEILAHHVRPDGTVSNYHNAAERRARIERAEARRYVEYLKHEVERNQEAVAVAKMRTEGAKVKLRATVEERATVERDLAKLDKAAVKRPFEAGQLQKQLQRLVIDLEAQHKEVATVEAEQKEAEAALAWAGREQTKALPLESDLAAVEGVERHKEELIASYQAQQEVKAAQRFEARRQLRERKWDTLRSDALAQAEHVIDVAQQSRRSAAQRIRRLREQERAEADAARAAGEDEASRRVRAILELKKSAEKTAAELRAKNDRQFKARAARDEQEAAERAAILAAGGNPEEVFRRRHQEEARARAVRQREVESVERSNQIMQRIKDEEKRYRRRMTRARAVVDEDKRLRDHTSPLKQRARIREFVEARNATPSKEPAFVLKPLHPLVALMGETATASPARDGSAPGERPASQGFKLPPLALSSGLPEAPGDMLDTPSARKPRSARDEGSSLPQLAENMLVPEFPGLWAQKEAKVEAPTLFHYRYSKLQEERMEQAKQRRRSAVKRQIVGGREFTGPGFEAIPREIVFTDFEVNKVYKMKFNFTNVSFSFNTFKVLELPADIRDFFEIKYAPQGQMSAGLSCVITVIFMPKMAQDIRTSLSFLTRTGQVDVPIICTTPKRLVEVSADVLDLGACVLGEHVSKTVQLISKGAVEVDYSVDLDILNTDPPAELELPPASLVPLADFMPSTDECHDDPDRLAAAAPASRPTSPALAALNTKLGPGKMTMSSSGILIPPLLSKVETSEHTPPSSLAPKEEASRPVLSAHSMDGTIAPYGTVPLTLTFAPAEVGPFERRVLVTLDDGADRLVLTIKGVGSAIPTYLERDVVDFKTCIYDELYRDTIVVGNSGSSALKVRLELPEAAEPYISFLPRVGFVQARSTLSIQIKFQPSKGMLQKCQQFADVREDMLLVPVKVSVRGQALPLHFTIIAQVTAADLEVSPPTLDFGLVSVLESVSAEFDITNKSRVPLKFGFLDLKPFIDVQPDDGFGIILPSETLRRRAIFSPIAAMDHSFDLSLRTELNREVLIHCTGTGTKYPLQFEDGTLKFAATPVGDVATQSVYLTNISKAPQTFDIGVPANAPFEVSPAVGVIQPGRSLRIQVDFAPALAIELAPIVADVEDDAASAMGEKEPEKPVHDPKRVQSQRLSRNKSNVNSAAASAAKNARASAEKTPGTSIAAKKRPPPSGRQKSAGNDSVRSGDGTARPSSRGGSASPVKRSHEDPSGLFTSRSGADASDDSSEASAVRPAERQQEYAKYEDRADSWTLPCFIKGQAQPIFLNIRTAAIRPPVIVVSQSGEHKLDFGDVPTGQAVLRTITIQNIHTTMLPVSAAPMDPMGSFQLLNALRPLAPMATHDLIVRFTPHRQAKYKETLELQSQGARIGLVLLGTGSQPSLTIEPAVTHVDMGDVLVGETSEKLFVLRNTSSTFDVKYSIEMKREGELNLNNINAFTVVPSVATIKPGEKVDVMVTFAPDHASVHYFETLVIDVPNDTPNYAIQLVGRGRACSLYCLSPDPVPFPANRLAVALPPAPAPTGRHAPKGDAPQASGTLTHEPEYVTCTLRWNGDFAECDVELGNVKGKVKSASGEFTVEPLSSDAVRDGFAVDNMKGSLESGAKKKLVFSFTPPQDAISRGYMTSAEGRWVETEVKCTLKGGAPTVLQDYIMRLRVHVTPATLALAVPRTAPPSAGRTSGTEQKEKGSRRTAGDESSRGAESARDTDRSSAPRKSSSKAEVSASSVETPT